MSTTPSFRISGIQGAPFRHLFELNSAELAARNIIRMKADDADGFPCRVSLDHAPIGDELLLLNYEHQPAQSPYRASGPIFVSHSAVIQPTLSVHVDVIPAPIAQRLISFRAYDTQGLIVDADVAEGLDAQRVITRQFDNAEVHYLHLHYARRGCFACRVDRATPF